MRESFLLQAAQALWECWYSWYVMSFSWVLAGREQRGQAGLPRTLLSAEMALQQILAVICLERVFNASVQQQNLTSTLSWGKRSSVLFWHYCDTKGCAKIASFMYKK